MMSRKEFSLLKVSDKPKGQLHSFSAFPEFGVATADFTNFTEEIRIFDLVGLLQPNALPAANLPKEENDQRRFFTHALPEIWLLFAIEAEVDL